MLQAFNKHSAICLLYEKYPGKQELVNSSLLYKGQKVIQFLHLRGAHQEAPLFTEIGSLDIPTLSVFPTFVFGISIYIWVKGEGAQ